MGVGYRASLILAVVCGLSLTATASGHEPWVMTADQMERWLNTGKPRIFTELGWLNLTLISAALVFCIGWIRLGATGARELFPDLQARLAANGPRVALIIRLCLAWTFISAAFGIEPRVGFERFTHPTMIAADLDLHHMPAGGHWVREFQVLIAMMLLFGVYTRLAAILTLLLGLAGLIVFHVRILPYLGALWGCAAYLLLQGGGVKYAPMPVITGLGRIHDWLARQPRPRAQFLLRVLTGISILYAGVRFKVVEPQLIYGILVEYEVPVMHLAPGVFSLIMALVEVCAGVLIIAGVLLRPLSLFFLFAFILFAALLPESFTEHSLFYGAMLSLLFNGAGQWRRPEAKDKAANIVVVGGSFAAVHAVIRIQQLTGQFSRVNLSLIHYHGNLVFEPLLPEVISGNMQPGNVVSPLRRIAPGARIYAGKVTQIDSVSRTLRVRLRSGEKTLHYDELLLATDPVPDFSGLPGVVSHTMPMGSVGDALAVRKRAFDLLAQADEEEGNWRDTARWLTWVVVGSGQRAVATAIALTGILRAVERDYPVVESGWASVVLIPDPQRKGDLDSLLSPHVRAQVHAAGVVIKDDFQLVSIGSSLLRSEDGNHLVASLIVNARTRLRPLPSLQGEVDASIRCNDDLSCMELEHVWVANAGEQTPGADASPAEQARVGRALGENIWAASQGYPTAVVRKHSSRLTTLALGRYSIARWRRLQLRGIPAWALSRLVCLGALPGLERNLRVLIDWALDIPFRNDIAVLAPQTSDHFGTVFFRPGEVVVRQGDEGSTAYLVQEGVLGVYRDDEEIAELTQGDSFGEIALLGNRVRSASVRCKTPCRLTVFSQRDFSTLTAGSNVFAKAMREQAAERQNADW